MPRSEFSDTFAISNFMNTQINKQQHYPKTSTLLITSLLKDWDIL